MSLTVNVSGAGTLIGLGSADSNATIHGTEPERFVDHKYTWKGMLKAFIQSNNSLGEVTISVSGQGLSTGNAKIATVAEPVSFVSTEN